MLSDPHIGHIWPSKRSQKNSSSFTLIEMLVVIAIILILVSILSPVLSRATDQALMARCIVNQQQLVQAWNLFADDHNGEFPSSHDRLAGSNGGGSDRCWIADGAYNGANNGNSPRATFGTGPDSEAVLKPKWIDGIKAGTMWPYLNNIEVYRCPSSERHLVAYQSTFAFDNSEGAPDWNILADIKYPKDALLFVEETGWRLNADNGFQLRDSFAPDKWGDDLGMDHGHRGEVQKITDPISGQTTYKQNGSGQIITFVDGRVIYLEFQSEATRNPKWNLNSTEGSQAKFNDLLPYANVWHVFDKQSSNPELTPANNIDFSYLYHKYHGEDANFSIANIKDLVNYPAN